MPQVAEQCLSNAKDLSGLLLLHTAKGSTNGGFISYLIPMSTSHNFNAQRCMHPTLLRQPLSVALQVAEQCLSKAKDLSGLLLLHTAKGNASGMEDLVATCQAQGRSNVAFLGNFLLGHLDACVDLLISAGRTPEAAFFARTYTPHRISEVGPRLRHSVLSDAHFVIISVSQCSEQEL